MNTYHDEPIHHRKLNRDANGQVLFAGNGHAKKEETKPMSETAPTYVVMNPLAETIEEGNVIVERVQIAADELAAQIADERAWHANVREAEQNYEAAEMEALAEVIVQATLKEGPLAGIATSSKAYDIMLSNLKNQLRTTKLQRQWQSLERIRRSYELSQVDLRQAETQFAALRKVCELKTALVQAATI